MVVKGGEAKRAKMISSTPTTPSLVYCESIVSPASLPAIVLVRAGALVKRFTEVCLAKLA